MEITYLKPILSDHSLVPFRAVLQETLLCLVIHPDQSKALHITPGPFEVVHQGPDKVSRQGHAHLNGSMGSREMRSKIMGAELIGDVALFVGSCRVACAIFCDI